MKTGSFISLSLLSLAAAQPQHGHRHAEFHKKRDVVTDYQTVYTTAPAAVVFVDDQGKVLYTSTQYPTEAVVAAVPTSISIPEVHAASVDDKPTPAAHGHHDQPDIPSIPVQPPPATTLATSSKPPPANPTPPEPSPAQTSVAGGSGGYIGGGNGGGHGGGQGGGSTPPSTGSDGFGIAYSPYNNDGTCKTQDQVNADFEHISDYSIVRSYGVDCNQVSTILSAAKSKKMKVFLGVFNIQPASQLSADLQTLIKAVGGDWSIVHSVSIGNEDVNQGKAQPAAVVAATNSGRTQLRAAGFSGPVVHVDTFNQLVAHPELCAASDYAAANCHAFFDPNTAAHGAGAFVAKQAAAVKAACGGKDTYITESGWPHSGGSNGAAVPSPENQKTALAGLKSSFAGGNIFLFSAFDDLWKQNNAGTYGAEQYWGFLSS